MDKFGIFNFLNAFSNYLSDKNTQKTDKSTDDGLRSSGDKNNIGDIFSALLGKSGKPDANDATNGLSNLFSNKKDGGTETKSEQKKGEPKRLSPLQNQMLSTMRSHDEFVKRVTKNAQKK